jgi:hypothetical protein
MIEINHYTGQYQSAITNQSKFNIRSHVLVHENPDAREYDDFNRALRKQGVEIGTFVKYWPRKKMCQYRLKEIDFPKELL